MNLVDNISNLVTNSIDIGQGFFFLKKKNIFQILYLYNRIIFKIGVSIASREKMIINVDNHVTLMKDAKLFAQEINVKKKKMIMIF